MTKGTRGSFNKKPEEDGGVSVSAPAELPGDEPVTVSAEVAESITSTNADSVIFTPDGSTPEETTPKATFALPIRPAIPMDSVIESLCLSALDIKETQQGSQQQPDQQTGPEAPLTKSKKRRMKLKERKKQQYEEEQKKKREQGAAVKTKPQTAPAAIAEAGKPSIKVAREQVMNLFDDYFGTRSLANWQRLCIDLGLEDKNISTVTQCKKALENINVNIYDFLAAIEERKLLPPDQQKAPLNIRKFDSVNQLFNYSEKHKRIFPKTAAKTGGKGSPLRALLRDFFGPRGGGGYKGYRGKKKKGGALSEGGVMV